MDEAASALGLARAAAERGQELYGDILRMQEELFVAGAELATDPAAAERLEDGVSRRSPTRWSTGSRRTSTATWTASTCRRSS